MADITAELDLEIAKFRGALKTAQSQMAGFSKSASRQGQGIGSGLKSGIVSSFRAVGPVLAGVLAAVGVAKAGKAIGGEFAASVKTAADMEKLEISFEVLTGSPEQAKKTLQELRELGASTPLEFFDLAGAAKQLLAFGESADNIPEALRRIGDVSTAIGAPIGEIAEIYGKARVQGTLFAEDINQLTGRGIPILQAFSKQLGVPVDQVKKLASEGKVTFDMLEKGFQDMTGEGGQFAGMMERQSQTLGGLWSSFNDQITELRLAFGEPIADAIRPILAEGIGLVASLKTGVAAAGAAIAQAVKFIVAAFQTLSSGDVVGMLRDALVLAFKSGVNFLWKSLSATVQAMGTHIVSTFRTAIELFKVLTKKDFWKGMGQAFLAFGDALRALLLNAIASLLEGAAKIPGVEKLIGDAPEALRSMADEASESAKSRTTEAGDLLAGPASEAMAAIAQHARAVADSFKDGFQDTQDVFDASQEIANLANASARIQSQVAKNEAKAQEAKEGAVAKGGEAGGAAGKTGTLASGMGSLASAVSLLSGGGGQKLVLDQAKAQTKQLTDVNATLSRIEKKKPVAPKVVVQGRPVFANA